MDQTNLATILSKPHNLVVNLRKLMERNAISEAELARKTSIPQPTLHKILTGKTSDPRASTLKALADFFNTSIDKLYSTELSSDTKGFDSNTKIQSVPLINWSDSINADQFIKSLTPSNWGNWVVTEFLSQGAYALASKPSMEPRFPKGCVLIIDPSVMPEDGDLVVVHYPNTTEATIRELSIDGPTKLLIPICRNAEATPLIDQIKILGVLVKSVFSFH